MHKLSLGLRPGVFLGLFLFGVALGGSERRAHADIPPPDACTAPGQSCNNAGPSHDGAGTCTESTCTRSVPGPDGGRMPMMYTCNLCKANGAGGAEGGANGAGGAEGGAGGAGGTGGASGETGDAATGDAGAVRPSKGSGCSAGGPMPGAAGWRGGVLVVAGALGLLHARRRRRS